MPDFLHQQKVFVIRRAQYRVSQPRGIVIEHLVGADLYRWAVGNKCNQEMWGAMRIYGKNEFGAWLGILSFLEQAALESISCGAAGKRLDLGDGLVDAKKKFGYKPTLVKVAIAALAVFAHKDNPIKGFILKQLDSIFSSKRKMGGDEIIEWSQLGLDTWKGCARISRITTLGIRSSAPRLEHDPQLFIPDFPLIAVG